VRFTVQQQTERMVME